MLNCLISNPKYYQTMKTKLKNKAKEDDLQKKKAITKKK